MCYYFNIIYFLLVSPLSHFSKNRYLLYFIFHFAFYLDLFVFLASVLCFVFDTCTFFVVFAGATSTSKKYTDKTRINTIPEQ